MEEFNYAQLNKFDICMGISQLAAPVEQSHMVRISSQDLELLGKHYNRLNGTWESVEEDMS